MTRDKSDRHVHLLLLFAAVLIATSFPLGARITHALPPAVMMFIRFLLATLMFLPVMIGKHGFELPSQKSLLGYIVLSLPMVIFFWSMFESLRYTTVLNTGALFTLVPAMTALWALIINKDRTARKRTFGLLLGTIGAVWIVFRGSLTALVGLDLNYGDLVFLVGTIFLGTYNPLVKRFYKGEPMVVMTFWITLFGAAWFLLLSIGSFKQVDWFQIEMGVYLGIAYLSLFTTLATSFIVNYSTVRVGATQVAAYGFLTPLFVIIISILADVEPFEPVILPGMFLIASAMVFIQIEDNR